MPSSVQLLLAIHCARQCWRLHMTRIMISGVMFIISFCLQLFRISHSGWKHSLFHIALEEEFWSLDTHIDSVFSVVLIIFSMDVIYLEHFQWNAIVFYVGTGMLVSKFFLNEQYIEFGISLNILHLYRLHIVAWANAPWNILIFD